MRHRHRINLRRSARGFGLIEILMAVGITGVLTLAITSLFAMMNGEMNYGTSKFNGMALGQQMSSVLANTSKCTTSFAGQSIDLNADVSSVTYMPGTPLELKPGTLDVSKKLVVNHISFTKPTSAIGTSPAGHPLVQSKLLLYTAVANQAAGGGRALAPFVIGSYILEVDQAAGVAKILSCQTFMDVAQTCAALGGILTNGTCQIPTPPDTTCAALGGTWTANPPLCGFPAPPLPTGPAQCATLGGSWVNNACSFAGPTFPTPTQQCQSLGGAWGAAGCSFGTPTTTPTAAALCASLGGTFANSACTLPAAPMSSCANSFFGEPGSTPSGSQHTGTNNCTAFCINGSFIDQHCAGGGADMGG